VTPFLQAVQKTVSWFLIAIRLPHVSLGPYLCTWSQ